jgi:uncharacterized damage-inducible protein DinB
VSVKAKAIAGFAPAARAIQPYNARGLNNADRDTANHAQGDAMLHHLRDLLAHAEWANAVFFHAWAKSPARDNEEMRRRVGHVVGVLGGFLSVLRGDPVGAPPEGPPPTFDQLQERAVRVHNDLKEFAGALDNAGLARTVRIPWFPDPPCIITVADALVQGAMHTQHHRGQLMTRLKDFGGEPKNVDWIIWLWKGKPEPRWS